MFGVVCVGREKENEEKEIACETLFFLIFVYFALLFYFNNLSSQFTFFIHSYFYFNKYKIIPSNLHF